MNNLTRYSSAADVGAAPFVSDYTPADLLSVLRRRMWLIIPIMIVSILGGYILARVSHKMWRAEAELVLVQRPIGGKSLDDPSYVPQMPETIESQVAIMQTPAMIQKVSDWFINHAQQTNEPPPPELSYLNSLVTVTNPKGSDVISLTVDAPNRDDALTLANGASLAFVQWKKELAQQDIQDTENLLVTQTADAQVKMQAAIQALDNYRTAHNIVDMNGQESATLSQFSSTTSNIEGLRQELASEDAQLSILDTQLQSVNSNITSGGGVRDDNLVASLQSQLYTLRIQRADEAQRVTKYYPGILTSLDRQIADLNFRIQNILKATASGKLTSVQDQESLMQTYKQVQAEAAATNAKLASATASRATIQQQLSSMPQIDTAMISLQRDVATATQSYTTLQNALDAARLQVSSTSGDIQLLESAVAPMDPFKPNVGTDVGVGTLVGFLICFGTILILEQAQRRVHTIAQLEEYRLAPILGVLPTLPKADVKLIEGGQWTESTSESFTILRNNLLEMRAHTSSATGFIALVTSAGPQEGKSFILAELARSMVDEGLRVIVVDANLREPSMSKYFPVDTRLGLAELLTEQWTYDDISTVVEQNLEVVHAGVKRVEATRYILSQKMLNFLADVRSRADLVLIDSPGCNIADPLLLAPHVDQVIYVVGISKTDEQAVRGALDALSAVSQVGIMVNNANMKHVLPHQFVNAASKMAVRLDDFGPENVGGLIKWTGPYQQLSKSNGNGAGDVGEVIPIPTNSGESQ